jgi:hypothetical protein
MLRPATRHIINRLSRKFLASCYRSKVIFTYWRIFVAAGYSEEDWAAKKHPEVQVSPLDDAPSKM